MTDHGVILSSGFRFGFKIWPFVGVRRHVVDGTKGKDRISKRIASTDTRSNNSDNAIQRDQLNTSFGAKAEKVGSHVMDDSVTRAFEELRKSHKEVQDALSPYLDASDPLIALTITLLNNKKKDKDCDKSHS